jgi:hypothetical protein
MMKLDCVETQHQATLNIYKKLKGKTIEVQMEFCHIKNHEMLKPNRNDSAMERFFDRDRYKHK